MKLTESNENDAARALKTYAKLTSQAQIEGTRQAYKGVWQTKAFPADQMQAILKSLADANPPVKAAATASVSSIIDNQYVSAAR